MTLRRSVRGKNETTKDAEEKEAAPAEPPTSLEKAESMLWTEGQQGLQKSEGKSASAELQSGEQTQEGCLDEQRSRMDIKGKKKSKKIDAQSTSLSWAESL